MIIFQIRYAVVFLLAVSGIFGVFANDNAIQLASSDLPFGGFGESGVNRYHGRSSFDTFSNKKSIVRRFQFLDWVNAPFRYAPDFKNLAIVRWVWKLFG